MARLEPERRDYVIFTIQAFEWWLSDSHAYDIGSDIPGSTLMPSRDRIIDLWSKTQPLDSQSRIDAAIMAQSRRMAQRR